ncbi:MAG: methyltransferase [Melioribacteraceae bacterium]|nr:methyltransferase [Melioribacteraceae bacterium]
MVYDLNYPWDIVILMFQIISLIGLIWAASAVKLFEFAGIAQIKRYYKGEYNVKELDERYELKKTGAFKYSRHPIYFFSILFLGLRPTMDFFYLIFFICLTLYFIIGSIYEEKKLVELFGSEYVQYKKETPWLVPLKILKS